MGIFQNSDFPPPSARSMRGFFSSFHSENLMGLLEVKLMKYWDPTEMLILNLLYTEPLAICQL